MIVEETFKPVPSGQVRLLDSIFKRRFNLNRRYLMDLRSGNLLQNHYMEDGLWGPRVRPEGCHWGWESPTCELRGHFLGHWLSAAARVYGSTGDAEIKGKADWIVAELARCQVENGGEWAGSIPERYLGWVARGKRVWAPHYTLHKTLMGLCDMAAYAGNEQALDILVKWAGWFLRWTSQFSRQELDEILDVETGGMLEAWADLYGLTGSEEHLELMQRYDRPRLFERLLAGEDPLTNRHANTTIPEAHGAARAYEVTGEARWREIVEAYWRCGVTDRGTFCTGGQITGEIWTPPFEFSARLGDKNQEHCVVYNMMCLADYLLRWTGDVAYADYIERNLYNGILAQQHPETGMIAYFLPLRAGGKKIWGTPTEDFWCCHGSLVQAHTLHDAYVYYEDKEGLAVSQYIPTRLGWAWNGTPVKITQVFDAESSTGLPRDPDGSLRRPGRRVIELSVCCDEPAPFALKLRLPWWVAGQARILVNGQPEDVSTGSSSFHAIRRTWQEDTVRVELPTALSTCPLPDRPDVVAFMDGPVVLAGLCGEERELRGDKDDPGTMLIPDNEREWTGWKLEYRTQGQERTFRFVPLYEVRDEPYTVYFPVRR